MSKPGGVMEIQEITLGERIDETIRFKQENNPEDQSIIEFLQSLANSYSKYGRLTYRQHSAFEKIESFTKPEVIEEHNKWKEEYRKEHREKALVIANQYFFGPGGYYASMSTRILTDDKFVPSRAAYEKMCDNKYANKAYHEITREPKYSIGSLIMLRSAATVKQDLRGKLGIVIKNDYNYISSFAKGSKRYNIVLVGKRHALVSCEERHIKSEL